ncbi:MAG TPA: glutamyl-tRNA reductase [Verrucomicrobiales bacterium]|nr:glutamyl-tRNA reductase [Verrucomicrobiales bacterium]
MSVLVIGLSHHSSPVTVRERFAFSETEIPDVLGRIREAGLADEAVILSTCNRVELYASSPLADRDAILRLREFLLQNRRIGEPLADELYGHVGDACLEHLFKVAAGLDSMLLGETEILGQLKQAYDLALKHRYTGKFLNKAFQRAFNVAKQIRTETNIQRGSVSVASAAVELSEKIFENLSDKKILVIGAGDTSEKTARALLSRGAHSVFVSNRSHDRAVLLAEALGGRAIRFDDWATEFANVDIVISSTSAPHYVIDRKRLAPLMPDRAGRALLLIDIAVPRDIEPEVNFMENVFLYNIDDLQAIADDYLKQRQEEVARCEAIIREKVKGLFAGPPPHVLPAAGRQAAGAA